MKKYFAAALALVSLFSFSAFANEAQIEKTVYEGMGVVDVDFVWDVQFSNLQVTVQDQDGFSYDVTIRERDDDDLVFQVQNIVPNQEYTYTVTGVRSGFGGDYGSVTGSFFVPSNEAPAVKSVEYDAEDREIDVEFFTRVSFENAALKVFDLNGKEYEATVREVDGDGFEAYVPGLKRGESYTLQVEGVSDGEKTGTAEFTFTAWDD